MILFTSPGMHKSQHMLINWGGSVEEIPSEEGLEMLQLPGGLHAGFSRNVGAPQCL